MNEKSETDNFFDSITNINKKTGLIFIFIPIIMSLFFIEALRAYIPGVYSQMFHVVFQDEGWEMSLLSLLTLILFSLPLFTRILCKKFKTKRMVIISILVIAISRLFMSFKISVLLDTVFCGLIIGFYGIFVGSFIGFQLINKSNSSNTTKIGLFSSTFFIAILIDFFIRTLGFTADYTLISWPLFGLPFYYTQYIWIIFQAILSLITIILPLKYWSKCTKDYEPIEFKPENEKKGKNFIALLSGVGLGAFLFLEINLFLYPNVIAQYTNTDYYLINIIVIGMVTLTCILFFIFKQEVWMDIKVIGLLNILFIIGFVIFVLFGHILGLFAAIFASISVLPILIDVYILFKFAVKRGRKDNKVRMFSNIFAIGFGIMLLLVFIFDFTTDWSFIIEALRNCGPAVLIIGAILLAVPVIIESYIGGNNKGGSEK